MTKDEIAYILENGYGKNGQDPLYPRSAWVSAMETAQTELPYWKYVADQRIENDQVKGFSDLGKPDQWFQLSYQCSNCEHEWEDATGWNSLVNDQCPNCGVNDISPDEADTHEVEVPENWRYILRFDARHDLIESEISQFMASLDQS